MSIQNSILNNELRCNNDCIYKRRMNQICSDCQDSGRHLKITKEQYNEVSVGDLIIIRFATIHKKETPIGSICEIIEVVGRDKSLYTLKYGNYKRGIFRYEFDVIKRN